MKKPSKKLGQNFLKDKSKVSQFIDALELKENETIIEIGPGTGVITKELLKNKINLICIEKDEILAKELSEELGVEIIRGDVLKALPSITNNLKDSPYKLVGNIPYYITGKLFKDIEELEHKPELSVLGVQKQVAERLLQSPPKMNILAASIQFWAKPSIVSIISKNSFSPKPKVDGAIIKLETKEKLDKSEQYYKALKIIFKHPRKTVVNNLSKVKELDKEEIKEALESKGVLPFWRPENLSVNDIKNIASILYKVN